MKPQHNRILIVDDDSAIRIVTEATLGHLGGFEVTTAESGRAAVELCRHESFDLILIDVMMPRLDGPATVRILRDEGLLGTVPFAFLTAKVQSDARETLLGLGATEVIAKPFDPTSLVETARQLIDGRS